MLKTIALKTIAMKTIAMKMIAMKVRKAAAWFLTLCLVAAPAFAGRQRRKRRRAGEGIGTGVERNPERSRRHSAGSAG